MKSKKIVLLGGFVVVIAVVVGLIIYGNSQPGQHNDFAQCLAESGAKMYSAWWCPHCQEQKKLFGKSFKVFDEYGGHIECSPNGQRHFSEFCLSVEGFQGTPYWVMEDGTALRGRQALSVLAQHSGCSL